MSKLRQLIQEARLYLTALAKWLALAGVNGLVCGLAGSWFYFGVCYVTKMRAEYPWLLMCLPLAGLGIVWFYKMTKTEGQGTNDIIEAVRLGKGISIWLLPAIFMGTMLTHLCGGSAGREGAALQMGGTIGHYVGRLFRLDDRDLRIATLSGMAAFFSALFGTPLAATMFAIMVVSVGVFYHSAFIPCFTASLVAYGISVWLGVKPTRFVVAVPMLDPWTMVEVAVLAVGCALVSIVLCDSLRFAGNQLRKWVPNSWMRVVIGGLSVIIMTYLSGTTDYNGTGMNIISAAIEQGSAHPLAFLLKIVFTAVTLGAGFKGGEIVPTFFVGATFGCVAAPLLGIPAGFGAAIGLAAVFSGATNCPMSAVFLSMELFGSSGLLYFALACGISYMLSGYNGLYSSQTILYSKLKAQYINVKTNHHHAGQTPSEDEDEKTE